jgi:malate dehydrogenase
VNNESENGKRDMITIVGSGRVGSTVAANLIPRSLDDILLIDIIKGLPQGESLDLGHMASSYGVDISVRGTNDYNDITDSRIVIITAGLPRKPGMTRLDLLRKNAEIIKEITMNVKKYAPKTLVLMVTNPLDAMTYVALKTTGFKIKHVFGMGGMLDSARFRYFIAKAVKVPHSSVNALVIGEHGESMLPLLRYSTVAGKPLSEVLTSNDGEEVVERTRQTAAEVIALKGGTVYAPSNAVGEMVETILKDRKEMMPLSAYLTGEYGVQGLCIGVPAILGRNGIEKIVELKLEEEEQAVFLQGVNTLRPR